MSEPEKVYTLDDFDDGIYVSDLVLLGFSEEFCRDVTKNTGVIMVPKYMVQDWLKTIGD